MIVKPASSTTEREMTFKLRYQIFVEEGGDERYADHAGQRHIDADDGDMSVALIAYDGAIPVGTARLTMLRDHHFIGQVMHDFDYIAHHLGYAREGFEQVIVRLDRGVVIKSHRNRGVFGELIRVFESLARDKGAKVAVGALWGQREDSWPALSRAGWLREPEAKRWMNGEWQGIFKHLV